MSSHLFVTDIKVPDHPYIKQKNIHITLPENQKKNIIITGKNGCGKSSLLTALKHNIQFQGVPRQTGNVDQITRLRELLKLVSDNAPNKKQLKHNLSAAIQKVIQSGALAETRYSSQSLFAQNINVLAYFEAKRVTNLSAPSNISTSELTQEVIGLHNSGNKFIHHLVNRRSQLSFAREDNDVNEVLQIQTWFDRLDELFSELFEQPMKLKFLRSELDFILVTDDGETIDLKTLSDGYSAIISIVTEIIIRMEAISFGDLNIGGIVLIDEVETHLHVSLQRHILRFLTKMFPNIQFIVTTHSPFVLASIDDAIIYDLESNETINPEEGLWSYSYEALVEGYFETERFSEALRSKIERYKALSQIEKLEREQKKELRQLTKELENVPSYKNAAIERELKSLGLK